MQITDVQSQVFLSECSGHLECMEQTLLALESGGGRSDGARLAAVIRAARAIKSGAPGHELPNLAALAAAVEESLLPIEARNATPTPFQVTLLLRAVDQLRTLIGRGDVDSTQLAQLVDRLAGLSGTGGTAHFQGGRLNSLLVEDDFSSRLLLQTFLSRHGECHVAVNGKEAVEAFLSATRGGRRYDLICMDIMMPEMDGREAVRQVRQIEEKSGILLPHGAKIIMTTAVGDIREVIRCFRELCDGYLVKPIDLGKLTEIMRQHQLLARSS